MGRHLGIDFSWILVDFGGQVGAKLGSKIDKKSIQKGIEKQMPKRRRLGGVLEPSWRRLGPSWPMGYAKDGWVRRMRVGLSKGQIRPILSLHFEHATGSPASTAGAGGFFTLRAPAEAMPVAGGSMAGWLGGSLARSFGRLVATLTGGFAAG